MNVAFLFPGSEYDALDNWVRTIARYAGKFTVTLERTPEACRNADVVLLLTEARTYPRPRIDGDIVALRKMGKRLGVVHNNDNPGVPMPGAYPSFCWTEQSLKRLSTWNPALVRQPVLPPIMPPKERPLHIGTFGHIERKKDTLAMARWARSQGLSFTAFCPDVLTQQYHLYINAVRAAGANVVMYPWAERIEDLATMFEDVSHFLFILPKAKGGSGGSPTSPRFATAFARPVMVVDDEQLLALDGIYVFESLDDIDYLGDMKMPRTAWGPEQYIGELVARVLE